MTAAPRGGVMVCLVRLCDEGNGKLIMACIIRDECRLPGRGFGVETAIGWFYEPLPVEVVVEAVEDEGAADDAALVVEATPAVESEAAPARSTQSASASTWPLSDADDPPRLSSSEPCDDCGRRGGGVSRKSSLKTRCLQQSPHVSMAVLIVPNQHRQRPRILPPAAVRYQGSHPGRLVDRVREAAKPHWFGGEGRWSAI